MMPMTNTKKAYIVMNVYISSTSIRKRFRTFYIFIFLASESASSSLKNKRGINLWQERLLQIFSTILLCRYASWFLLLES